MAGFAMTSASIFHIVMLPLHRVFILVLGYITLSLLIIHDQTQSQGYQNSVCPAPLPCHCIKNDKVFCSFMRLKQLTYMEFYTVWDSLDLSENFLEHLPAHGFKDVKIRALNLSRNTINSIDTQAFDGILYLQHLDLSHNYLRTLPKMFRPLVELQSLKLCYNQLKTLKYDTFENIKSLQELDLTGNDFETVPTPALLGIPGLRKLILRHNRLTKIDAYAFNYLPIEVLDLGDNGAPLAIHEEAFCGLQPTVLRSEPGVIDWSGMQVLLLDHNGLATLTPCVTKLIWTLHTIDIAGNPLQCDCDIFSLKDFGTKTAFPGAQCAAPESFAGNLVNGINHTRYSCPLNRTAHACKRLCQSPPPAAYRDVARSSLKRLPCYVYLLLTSQVYVYCYSKWSRGGTLLLSWL